MAKLIKDLIQEVTIDSGFPGTYKWTGGTSYYLDGNTGSGEIHFSINGGDNDTFAAFHITYSITGSNVGIWYNGSAFSNVNRKNLPPGKFLAWNTWWAANKANCNSAATDFWNKLNA
jgi:hypothetical protein